MKTTAPEQKSVKTLKGQLFGAVSMMLVAAIALGTSTYAWFINNRAVTVEDMTLTVSTSTSMLVALEKYNPATGGTNGYTGYKNVITNDDIKGTATEQALWKDFFTVKMIPASITDTQLKSATPSFFATNNHVTNGLLDEFELVPDHDTLNVDDSAKVDVYGLGQGPVKKLGLRFVSSNDLDVYFGKDATLTSIADLITPKLTRTQAQVTAMPDGTSEEQTAKAAAQALLNTETAQAAAIRAALRVSVVAQTTGMAADGNTPDNATYTTVDLHTFQFDKGALYAPTNKNNTDYNGKNSSVTIAENNGLYAAIEAITDKKISTVGALNALVPGHATPASNADNTLATVATDGTVTAPVTNGIKLFQLKKDIARDVDVFIWLEGTDQDCLNSISGYLFNLKLPFAAADTPPTP